MCAYSGYILTLNQRSQQSVNTHTHIHTHHHHPPPRPTVSLPDLDTRCLFVFAPHTCGDKQKLPPVDVKHERLCLKAPSRPAALGLGFEARNQAEAVS